MAWATKDEARVFWADATSIPDAALDVLLEVATEACAAYAPSTLAPYPTGFMLATVYQAREVYAASQRGEQDVIGVGDYAIRARPLTAAVKQLLRPQSGAAVTG